MAIFPEFILLDAREIVNQKYDVCNEKIVAEKLYSTLMANKKFKKFGITYVHFEKSVTVSMGIYQVPRE